MMPTNPLVSRAWLPVNQFLSLVELLVSLPSSLLPIGTALRYHQQSIPIIILTTRFSTIFLARIGRIGDGRQHPEEEEVRLRQHGQPCQGRAQEEGGEGGRGDETIPPKSSSSNVARRPWVLGWMLLLVRFNMACSQNILVQLFNKLATVVLKKNLVLRAGYYHGVLVCGGLVLHLRLHAGDLHVILQWAAQK